ncbi:MAG: MoxR family ATPase, partial [Nanoarchaeota archaeon]
MVKEASSKKKASISEVKEATTAIQVIKKEIGKAFFGQEVVVDGLLRALICNGHVLMEGVPGIAKTLSIKTLAQVSGCTFQRIQFTADLLPTD